MAGAVEQYEGEANMEGLFWLVENSVLVVKNRAFDKVFNVYLPGNHVKHVQISFQSGQVRVDGLQVFGMSADKIRERIYEGWENMKEEGRTAGGAAWLRAN